MLLQLLRGAYKKTLQWESVAKTYNLGTHSDPLSLYNTLNDRLPEYFQVCKQTIPLNIGPLRDIISTFLAQKSCAHPFQFWTDTFQNSASSASWSSVLLSILSQGKPGKSCISLLALAELHSSALIDA